MPNNFGPAHRNLNLTKAANKSRAKNHSRFSTIHLVHLLTVIIKEDKTIHELADEIGLHYSTVSAFMTAAKAKSLIHICSWEKDSLGRDVTPVFRWGSGRNVAREKMTAKERMARWREKKKRDQFNKIPHLLKGPTIEECN